MTRLSIHCPQPSQPVSVPLGPSGQARRPRRAAKPSLSPLRMALAAATLAGLSAAPLAARASALDTINQLCLAGFSAAFSGSGKEPPPGMATYTCSCFVDRVSQMDSLADAQATCTRLASTRFRVL